MLPTDRTLRSILPRSVFEVAGIVGNGASTPSQDPYRYRLSVLYDPCRTAVPDVRTPPLFTTRLRFEVSRAGFISCQAGFVAAGPGRTGSGHTPGTARRDRVPRDSVLGGPHDRYGWSGAIPHRSRQKSATRVRGAELPWPCRTTVSRKVALLRTRGHAAYLKNWEERGSRPERAEPVGRPPKPLYMFYNT